MTDTGPAALPPDGHVHSEWSWDAPAGSMERTCARAVEIGLPAIAFTEHADFTPWPLRPDRRGSAGRWRRACQPDGVLTRPPLDVDGYLDCLHRCRDLFPGLRILSGVELSEPHWHAGRTAPVLDGRFDRVLGSVHSLPAGDGYAARPAIRDRTPARSCASYLAEVTRWSRQRRLRRARPHRLPGALLAGETAGRYDPRTSRTSTGTCCGPWPAPGGAGGQHPAAAASADRALVAAGGRRGRHLRQRRPRSGRPRGGSSRRCAMAEATASGRDPFDLWGRNPSPS